MNNKVKKLEKTISENLALIISEDMDNPIFDYLNINEVRLNNDKSTADVYVNFFQKEETGMEQLINSTAFLRKELSKRLNLRHTPQLTFRKDELLDEINKIDNLLED